MFKALGSRLTYANVVATGALFVALGGGAYALSGIPDRTGVYHGCVATTGALRVVGKASACRKAKTVRRGKRRVRIPGESAIAWNQQGRQGLQGLQGNMGLKGDQGPAGPTQGAIAAALNGSFPSSTPDANFALINTTVTTTTSGRLFAFGRGSYTETCTAGPDAELGLYVDGTPVRGSGRQIASGITTEISVFGLTDTLTAGTHTLALKGDCTGGDTMSAGAGGDGALGAIFVGS